MADANQLVLAKEEEMKKPRTLGLIRQKFKYGLVWYSIRNILAQLGLDILLYYWVVEGKIAVSAPPIKDREARYSLRYLRREELEVMNQISGVNAETMQLQMDEGAECVGMVCDDVIAAVMFIEYGTIVFKKRRFELKSNEAYLSNMYTFNAYRGKNLAPYLRYQSYLLLQERGFDTFYSVTDYWNKSSIKFKEKLGAIPQALYLHFGILKKIHFNFLIKEFH
jgi:hypothetical protein